jgi:hypothetical protein
MDPIFSHPFSIGFRWDGETHLSPKILSFTNGSPRFNTQALYQVISLILKQFAPPLIYVSDVQITHSPLSIPRWPTHQTLWVKVGPAFICGAVREISLVSKRPLSIQITCFHIFTVQSQASKHLCLYPISSLFVFF